MPRSVLVLGASYGSLLGTKLALAGHDVTLVGTAEEAGLIRREGTRVRMPLRGAAARVELDSREGPGRLSARTPREAVPDGADLVVLAMQEPHYRAPEMRSLLARIGESGRPCLSVMNMPPLSFLRRRRRSKAGPVALVGVRCQRELGN